MSHVKKCNKAEDFGIMEFVIDGKNYALDNSEWMSKEQAITKKALAQGGTIDLFFEP
jgi:hypothetical protein